MVATKLRAAAAVLAFLVGSSALLHAEGIDVGVGIGFADAGKRKAGTIQVDDGIGGQIPSEVTMGRGILIVPRMTLNTGDYLSHDLSFSYSRAGVEVNADGQNLFDGGTTLGQFMYNMLLHATKDGSKIRPYVAGGGGIVMFYPPGAGLTSGVNTIRPGLNYGAGVRFQATERWHARVDFRQTIAPNPRLFQGQEATGTFRQNQVSFGIGVSF